jgi:hypothetical protein
LSVLCGILCGVFGVICGVFGSIFLVVGVVASIAITVSLAAACCQKSTAELKSPLAEVLHDSGLAALEVGGWNYNILGTSSNDRSSAHKRCWDCCHQRGGKECEKGINVPHNGGSMAV